MFAVVPSEMEVRVQRAQQALDEWKGRPIDWAAKVHCVRFVAEHLRRMGYRPPLSKGGSFTTLLGARRALRRAGCETLGDAVDLVPDLLRIPPAAALPSDVIELAGNDGIGALTIAMGNGRVAGWHEDAEGVVVLQPSEFVTAWRVTPR